MPKIACVIVLYNPRVSQLSKQLAVFSKQLMYLILVDNSYEHDEDIENLITKYSCQYIKNNNNLGVAAAQNIGIKLALEQNCSHVLLMDQDSLPADDMVVNLLNGEKELLAKGINVGAVGPSIYDARLNSKKSFRKLLSPKNYSGRKYLIASGTLIRNTVLQDIGLMNEALFIDGVDYDWCFRAINKGYKLFCLSEAKMYHELGNIKVFFNGKIVLRYCPAFRYYFLFRNYIFLIQKDYTPLLMKFKLIGILAKVFFKIFFLPEKNNYIVQSINGIKGVKNLTSLFG